MLSCNNIQYIKPEKEKTVTLTARTERLNQKMRRAAEFVKNLKLDELDESTIKMAKNCFLDFVGAVLGGAKTRAGEISLTVARSLGGPEQATVWPTNDKFPCQSASFVHGTMGTALDIDDGHRLAVGHPGGVVIPAAFSIAENNKNSGREFLEAIVCGYEVAIRAGHILRIKTNQPVSIGSGRWGSLGAAAAVAKLLHLDLKEIEQALAISATFSPVAPVTNDLSTKGLIPMSKFSSGWGSMVGIYSALLAKWGFTGITSAIDFSSSLLPDFGQFFEINNVYFKPYTSCRWTHSAIEGTILLINRHNDLGKTSIKRISVKTFFEASHLREPHPQTMESAQYSIPFLVGAAVIDGDVGPDQISEERLSDPDILSIADRVEVLHDPEFDRYFPKMTASEVEIKTVSGGCYRSKITNPRGDPRNPLSDKELLDKFRRLAKRSISLEAAERVIEAVKMLEKYSNLVELNNFFSKK